MFYYKTYLDGVTCTDLQVDSKCTNHNAGLYLSEYDTPGFEQPYFSDCYARGKSTLPD